MAAVSVDQSEVLGRSRQRVRPWTQGVLLPAGLVVVGIASAGALAYGTRASLAAYDYGIDLIILVRRVQWLLVGISLIGSMSLITIIIANRGSPWWLAGLVPVMALFAMRFAPDPGHFVLEIDESQFAPASHPAAPGDDDWVVGLIFEGDPYAFPYRALHLRPIVAVTDYSKRMLLMWSPHANRAVAVNLTRDLRPRALEVVSTPADGLLVLDRRYGQFISSITGRLAQGDGVPIGFSTPIAATKTTWASWRRLHPQTRVLLLELDENIPCQALLPQARLPLRITAEAPGETIITLLATQPPVAIPAELPVDRPLNLGGAVRVLLLRDPSSGLLRAFERRCSEDLFPVFTLRTDRRVHPEAILLDSDSGSLWTADGRAVAGPLAGEQLRSIPIEENLYWGPMKFWYPQLQFVQP